MRNESTKIEFDYGGDHYCLQFTAASIKKMEEDGFKFGKMDETILTAPEKLFSGAFIANHKRVPESKRHEIYLALSRTMEGEDPVIDDNGREVDALTNALAEMLSEAIDDIMGRGEKGNVSWKIVK